MRPPVPFAALPHDIAADPRLTPTDVRVLAALFYFARADPSCWPSDDAIADRVHRHPGTVRRALRRLEDLGYIRREFTRANPTGRLIHLTCKEPDWPRPEMAPTPVRRRVGGSSAGARGGRAPARADGNVIVKKKQDREPDKGEISERSRPESPPTPAAPSAQPMVVNAPLSEALSPAPPDPTPRPEAAPALAPPPLASPVQAFPPAPEVGPQEARPAILRTLAGPTPQSAPSPVPGGIVAPAEVDPRQSPASPPCAPRLARSQSEPLSELGPSALVTAPGARPGLASPQPTVPPKAANLPVPGPTKVGPAPALTPEQQTLLSNLPEAVQQQVYLWLMSGDVILMREAQRRLTPPRPRPAEPQTLPELLAQIQSDPSYPAKAADWLCTVLKDRKSYSGFKARCEEAWRGELNPDQLVSAYDQAMSPKARNRGAIFMVAVKRRE